MTGSNRSRTSRLFPLPVRDERGEVIVNTTIELLVADWQANAV